MLLIVVISEQIIRIKYVPAQLGPVVDINYANLKQTNYYYMGTAAPQSADPILRLWLYLITAVHARIHQSIYFVQRKSHLLEVSMCSISL